MTVVDWVILALALLMALHGYRRGFLAGVAALAGFIGGALAGSRVAPLLLSRGAHSPYAPLFALGGALLLGTIFSNLFEGIARRVRRLLLFPPLRIADGVAGALLTAFIALGIAWIAGAALLQAAPGVHLPVSVRRDLQRSAILKALNRALPPSGPILNALASIDPLPSVDARLADVPAPDPAIVRAAGVKRAGRSVVRITGVACGLGVEGSGWVAGPDTIVTNAHVVAGEAGTLVQRYGRGLGLRAQVLVFDQHNDIAILRVAGLNLPALRLASDSTPPASGTSGAVLGYPLDGAFKSQPARVGVTQFTAAANAYGNPTVREISSLRGLVQPGNSGGPLVERDGKVMGTVFAELTNPPEGKPGGFAIPDTVVSAELAKASAARGPVSTQGCAD